MHMEIDILKRLRDNPRKEPFENEPLTDAQIRELEAVYNNNRPFPKALREMLFLAGAFCIVMDYGSTDSQQEMQDEARAWLVDYERLIERPFYVIDIYNEGYQFVFIYLDEEDDDPIVYEAALTNRAYYERPWIHSINKKLSQAINIRLDAIAAGHNPW